jgi:hypothetical protein
MFILGLFAPILGSGRFCARMPTVGFLVARQGPSWGLTATGKSYLLAGMFRSCGEESEGKLCGG